jgi:hypothetical protein
MFPISSQTRLTRLPGKVSTPQPSRPANSLLLNLWNAVASKREYLERLKLAVEQLHGCSAAHVSTVPVREVFQGNTVSQGEVEVFDLTGHLKAKRCYAWSTGTGLVEGFAAVLEVPQLNEGGAIQAASNAQRKRWSRDHL